MSKKQKTKKGFTLIELLVVIAIIAILSTLGTLVYQSARTKARDAKRISDVNQIGNFLSFGCQVPGAGPGEYDLNELIEEFKAQYPQYANTIPNNLFDPLTGNETVSNYKYIIDENNDCVLYTNLENEGQAITLPNIIEPTPGGGKGYFQAAIPGFNGGTKYFQVTN